MTRKIRILLGTLFILGLLLILAPNKAHADEIVTQIVSDPAPSTDTATVTAVITVETVQAKIDSATATLSSSAQEQSNSIISTIQANVPNIDASTAISIATTQEPIKTAVESATAVVQEANNAIQAAETAVQVVISTQTNVDTQTATVAVATAIVKTKQTELNTAVQNNQVAETALNTQTPITIAAQEANSVARTANDVAQATLVVANQAVTDQQAVVATDTQAVADAQTAAVASAAPGLDKTIYQDTGYNNMPPLGAGVVKVVTTDTNGINEQWGSGSPASGVLSDDFQVKWSGNIATTSDASVRFYAPADDGVKLYVNNTLIINDWYDKGGGGSQSAPVAFTANTPKPITLWFYENGGGANVVLYWSLNNSGYVVVPATAFTRGQVDPALQAALDAATGTLQVDQATLDTLIAAQNTAQSNADTTLQNYMDANQAMAQAEAIQAPIQQTAWDTRAAVQTASENLTTAQQNLTTEQQNLTSSQQNLTIAMQAADSLANTAIKKVNEAVTAMTNAAQVTTNYYAEQQRIAAEAEAARQAAIKAEADRQAALAAQAAAQAAADALAAQQAAQAAQAAAEKAAADKAAADAAQAKAEADAKAAADAAAKALADQQAADAAKAQAEAEAKAAQEAADAKAAQDKADAEAKAAQDAANAKAEADAKAAEQAAADKAAADAKAAADKAAQDAANKAAEQTKADAQKAAAEQAAKDAQAKADAAKAEADKAKTAEIGVKPNSPDQLSDTVVKEAPKEVLVPHIQVDVKGVENGGIQFFGTKSAPQVVGEDGKLTPPAPPPNSGLPIPPDAITTIETFIGQPGGTTFNAPDIAVPVLMTYVCETITKDGKEIHVDVNGVEHPVEQCTFLPAALNAIPGAGQAVQAVGAAYTALANIGNDMSPVTRKKAKKILVLTVAVAAIRRRFGS